MTLGGRLEALEASLTPTQRVIAWVEEAHTFGDLETYIRSLLEESAGAYPVNRLMREAMTAARTATRGKSGEDVNRAVHKEVRETIFRYELVTRINVTAHEMVDRQGPIHVAIVGHIGVLLLRQQYEPQAVPTYLEQLASFRDLASRQVDELLAHEAARSEVKARYLDDFPALFPAIATAWADRLLEIQKTTVLADRLCELDGAGRAELDHPDWVSARAATLARGLVDLAKTVTLERLDDGPRAFAIATDWLRSVLARREPASDGSAPAQVATR